MDLISTKRTVPDTPDVRERKWLQSSPTWGGLPGSLMPVFTKRPRVLSA